MSTISYKIREGSLQERFFASRAKIQFYGGGFANGKTSAACIRALSLAQDYPGAEILIARETYPKVNDTIKKEFLKWCPKHWIDKTTEDPNNVHLTNGTTINFRYIKQQGKTADKSSNLLSATYDVIIVDQIEDPGILHKDFVDLLGRLRGSTRYIGNDPTMPLSGPRWMIITANPTRNWVYHRLVKPVHDLARGIRNPNLLFDEDTNKPIIELFEGSTYENKENLEPDFIRTLEITYKGQMRDRFLLGGWAAYEGLVYPTFEETTHIIPHATAENYLESIRNLYVKPTIVEGYDYGLAVPSCYLLGFADDKGNTIFIDGFYQAEMQIHDQARAIEDIRSKYRMPHTGYIHADPAIFRRGASSSRGIVGQAISEMFEEDGILMVRGNSNIQTGIIKVQQLLAKQRHHTHPIYNTAESPRLYFSDRLTFLVDEFTSYMWKKANSTGEVEDVPVDGKDHALDTLKYALSETPALAPVIVPFRQRTYGPQYWTENPDVAKRKARHG